MTKSLYVRVIGIFIGVVIVSLFLSFVAITKIYDSEIIGLVQDDLVDSGKQIIPAYVDAFPEQEDMLMEALSVATSNSVSVYGPDGRLLHEDRQWTRRETPPQEEIVARVLNGEVYRDPRKLIVGLPFTIDGRNYALFNALAPGVSLKWLGQFLQLELVLVLGFGSVLILVAAMFIVSPLKKLTNATRRMSKGDFDVEIRTKRKDEIGQLTRSFNVMAKELGTLEKIRRQFVSDVSHEIQSPLTSIKGFTKALRRKKLDDETRERLLTIIEEESERLSRLGEDLLQLSSLEYEHQPLNKETYSLDEQIRKVVIALEPQWSPKSIRMDVELDDISVTADQDKLYRLWVNLIGNAIKFTASGGTIRVEASRTGSSAVVSVEDTGQGIPAQEIEHIFRPFYKADASRTSAVAGNGIGLSIAKRIVDLHGGDIRADSEVSVGTTFTVELPIEPEP